MSALPVSLATGARDTIDARGATGARGEALASLSFDALCAALAARGIALDARAARAGRLALHAPDGAMTPTLGAALALHRRALLAAVTATPAPVRPVSVCGWGAPHFHAWRYHAGERRLVCALCYPLAWHGETIRATIRQTPPDAPTPASTPPDSVKRRQAVTRDATPTPTGAPMPSPDRGPMERASASSARPSGDGKRGADRLAVLDASGVWIERPHTVGAPTVERLAPDDMPTPGACHVGALVALAARLDVTQLWVHPSWAQLAGLPMRASSRDERREGIAHPFTSDALADGWDVQPTRLAPWLVGLRPGVWGRYALVFPHLDTRARWSDAPDGATLLQALMRYRAALAGYAYHHSPGASATGLLKRLHASEHALDLAASMTPGDFPPPAREPATVTDMAWLRPLTSGEQALADRGPAYVHGYDKHAMYLGAASALWLGMGAARHVAASGGAGSAAGDELAGLVAGASTKTRMPGYWLASIAYDPPDGMPNPFADMLAPGADRATWRADAPRWITTPTLDLAASLGARVDVREAWVWSERHRPLETWRNALKDARETLTREARGLADDSAPALALAALKATYTQGIGWLDGSWLRKRERGEALYRPDWRHAVMAQARANFYRNGLAVYQAHGRAPIAAYTDAWYYVSADADAARACPSTDKVLRLDAESLAGWSVKASAPLARVRPALDALATLTTPRGVRAWRAWRDTMNALHAEDAEDDADTDGASAPGALAERPTESEG